MKLLIVHANSIEFQATKKAIDNPPEVSMERHRVEECLVVFTAAEKSDETGKDNIMAQYLDTIKDLAAKCGTTTVVVYPYAHLSSELSSLSFAGEFVVDAVEQLRESFDVHQAPFGWYKTFALDAKGHPLAESGRTLSAKPVRKHTEKPFEHKGELDHARKLSYTAALKAAVAIKALYPKSEPVHIDFYHDDAFIDVANVKLSPEQFKKIGKAMKKVQLTVQPGTAQREYTKVIEADTSGTVLNVNGLDICAVYNDPVADVDLFEVVAAGSVYWRGSAANEQLSRLRVVGFANDAAQADYIKRRDEAEARSHIKLGKELGLFTISKDVGPGLPLLTPRGMTIRREIENYLWSLHEPKGYQWVWTPHIAKENLYKISGHYDKFGDELFRVQGKSDRFILKPMNCPHHLQIFKTMPNSYRDYPIRFFEPATIYRDEKSGQLHGLTRVRSITQDDGHVLCMPEQLQAEISTMVEIIREFYQTVGMNDYWVSLSVRDDDHSKYIGDASVWDSAESALEDAAKQNGLEYKRVEGEAAFYGPKLDFMFTDALGREWQLATIQCDFNLPKRFNVEYVTADNERKTPIMVHRAIIGSFERFMGIMIEHYAGRFPLWLNPEGVRVVAMNTEYGHALGADLRKMGIRVHVDDRNESMGKKVREAQLSRSTHVVIVGDKEAESGTVSMRDGSSMDRGMFLTKMCKELENRE